jgi:hypothetical protein
MAGIPPKINRDKNVMVPKKVSLKSIFQPTKKFVWTFFSSNSRLALLSDFSVDPRPTLSQRSFLNYVDKKRYVGDIGNVNSFNNGNQV